MSQTAIVVPNWNGLDSLGKCLDSLKSQGAKIIVVENGSTDGSLEFVKKNYPEIELIVNQHNKGFVAVNQGIAKAIEDGMDYVALFNNDAVADKDWLNSLVGFMDRNPGVGLATCKFMKMDKKSLDSTGDMYTVWGLPYPRGRGEKKLSAFDNDKEVFGVSGGASIYRAEMLKEIGLFDEDFFAYFEDVDLSFRAQFRGWKAAYVPEAEAYHEIGATSGKIKGFNRYHSTKNFIWLFYKNVPRKYMGIVGRRFLLVFVFISIRAIMKGDLLYLLKGLAKGVSLLPKKTKERKEIQSTKKVTDEYIWSIITHDLPPNASALRALRSTYWRLTGK